MKANVHRRGWSLEGRCFDCEDHPLIRASNRRRHDAAHWRANRDRFGIERADAAEAMRRNHDDRRQARWAEGIDTAHDWANPSPWRFGERVGRA